MTKNQAPPSKRRSSPGVSKAQLRAVSQRIDRLVEKNRREKEMILKKISSLKRRFVEAITDDHESV